MAAVDCPRIDPAAPANLLCLSLGRLLLLCLLLLQLLLLQLLRRLLFLVQFMTGDTTAHGTQHAVMPSVVSGNPSRDGT